jgi:hypothetical protein
MKTNSRSAWRHVLVVVGIALALLSYDPEVRAAAQRRRHAGPRRPQVTSRIVAATHVPSDAALSHKDLAPGAITRVPVSRNTVTIEGQLVYNDLREDGHYSWRYDEEGKQGAEATGKENYLGAYYVVADFYELDSVSKSLLHTNCKSEDYLGSVTLDRSGKYSFSSSATDNCDADKDTTPDIGVIYRLSFSNDDVFSFAVEDNKKDLYEGWDPHANPDNPLKGTAGTHQLAVAKFETDTGDDYVKAVNNYAYLVDAILVWHYEGDVPFDPRNDKTVYVQFPSTEADNNGIAYTGSDHRIYLQTTWNYQSTVWHEYGHILHMRAWDGTTGSCGDCPGGDMTRGGDDGWSGTSLEYPHVAFKEGWAEFAKAVVVNWPLKSCGSIDDNEDNWICSADPKEYPTVKNRVTYPDEGEAYVRNVKKLLCDWYDDRSYDDDDALMAGNGDKFTADTLYSVWYNFHTMWDWVSSRKGLTICEYMDYYLNSRKSSSKVGSDEHDLYVTVISDLAYNNGIACGLSSSGTGSDRDVSDKVADGEDKIEDKLDKLKEHYDAYGPH